MADDDWGDWDNLVALWKAGEITDFDFIQQAKGLDMENAADMMVYQTSVGCPVSGDVK